MKVFAGESVCEWKFTGGSYKHFLMLLYLRFYISKPG